MYDIEIQFLFFKLLVVATFSQRVFSMGFNKKIGTKFILCK